jgi:hypothetical protein
MSASDYFLSIRNYRFDYLEKFGGWIRQPKNHPVLTKATGYEWSSAYTKLEINSQDLHVRDEFVMDRINEVLELIDSEPSTIQDLVIFGFRADDEDERVIRRKNQAIIRECESLNESKMSAELHHRLDALLAGHKIKALPGRIASICNMEYRLALGSEPFEFDREKYE